MGSSRGGSGGTSGGSAADARVLGVVGTFVLDRVVGLPGMSEPVEGLGGIAYALATAATTLPDGWSALPIARVGADAAPEVRTWLRGSDLLDSSALLDVPESNNRVELHYRDAAHRTERLRGGVGGWRWEELAPRIGRCDALLVNFISGHEIGLEDARRVRRAFSGPIYADLHSLFLDTADDGTRIPRILDDWRAWVACFDAVQINADEFSLLGEDAETDAIARAVLEAGPGLLVCTLGDRGATCWTREDRSPAWTALADEAWTAWDGSSDGSSGGARVVRREIPVASVRAGDPTGCGDVWGAAMFCTLLAGAGVEDAALAASRMAAVSVSQSGVAGLMERFAREGSRVSPNERERISTKEVLS